MAQRKHNFLANFQSQLFGLTVRFTLIAGNFPVEELSVNSRSNSRLICPPSSIGTKQILAVSKFLDKTIRLRLLRSLDRFNYSELMDAHIESINWGLNGMDINGNMIVLGDFIGPFVKLIRYSSGFLHPDSNQSSVSNLSCELPDASSTAGPEVTEKVVMWRLSTAINA